MVHLPDLVLLQRAAVIIPGFSQRTRKRASAHRGTAQILRWQSSALLQASIGVVTEAERLVEQSRRSRDASGEYRCGP
jgi:hypothetical protein